MQLPKSDMKINDKITVTHSTTSDPQSWNKFAQVLSLMLEWKCNSSERRGFQDTPVIEK